MQQDLHGKPIKNLFIPDSMLGFTMKICCILMFFAMSQEDASVGLSIAVDDHISWNVIDKNFLGSI
jgi:hypothetical protein